MARVFKLKTPLKEDDIEKLCTGDIVYIDGVIVTARDQAHKRICSMLDKKEKPPIELEGGVIYHCGPVVSRRGSEWIVVAAGPTTSYRMESYEHRVICELGVKAVIGKGGMGEKTRRACRECKAVYLTYTGGAAVLAADKIKRVVKVEWLDLGVPEALWVFEVSDFGPLIVTIDSRGEDLIERVISNARVKLSELLP